jgi:chromosome partitioning protein
LDPFKLTVPGSSRPPKVAELATNIRSDSATGARLDLIPSTLSLMYVALGQADGQVDVIERRFAEFIAEAVEAYDLVLIDCHPAGSLMTRTALSNSDHVVIPVAPSNYSLRGIALMMDFISKAKQPGSTVGAHILFNRVERNGVSPHETTVRANPRFAGYCLNSRLKQYKVFSDLAEGRGFVDYSSKPYSTEAFHNLNDVCRELLLRVGA